MGWEVHPDGLRRSLVRLAVYGRPLYVTENGIATTTLERRPRPSATLFRDIIQANAISPPTTARYDRVPTAEERANG